MNLLQISEKNIQHAINSTYYITEKENPHKKFITFCVSKCINCSNPLLHNGGLNETV